MIFVDQRAKAEGAKKGKGLDLLQRFKKNYDGLGQEYECCKKLFMCASPELPDVFRDSLNPGGLYATFSKFPKESPTVAKGGTSLIVIN